jgi:hypothetical protein
MSLENYGEFDKLVDSDFMQGEVLKLGEHFNKKVNNTLV